MAKTGQISNVSDATLKKHIRAVSALKHTLETAQGEYRAALKAAKTEGINTGQLIAAMAAKKREVEDVHGDLKDYVRYLALFDMPVEQLDLFGAKIVGDEDEGDEDPETGE